MMTTIQPNPTYTDSLPIAAEYFRAEQAGRPFYLPDTSDLPDGCGLIAQTDGLVIRTPILNGGVMVLRYLSAGGYPRDLWVRSLSWTQLNEEHKVMLWSYGVVPRYTSPPSGLVYQAAIFEPGSGDKWEMCGHFALTPEEAVSLTIPWRTIESWQSEGLEVCHCLYEFAAILRSQAQEAAAERARTKAETAEQDRQLSYVRWCEFQAAYEHGRNTVTYRRGKIPVAQQWRDGRKTTSEMDGFKIVAATSDEEATGFGVWKEAVGKTARWSLTHLATGLMFPNFTFPNREAALALAGMFYHVWPGWAEVQASDDIPDEVITAAKDIVVQYREHNG